MARPHVAGGRATGHLSSSPLGSHQGTTLLITRDSQQYLVMAKKQLSQQDLGSEETPEKA